jgi:hypothetical protein
MSNQLPDWVQSADRTEFLIRYRGETIRGVFLDPDKISFKVIGTQGKYKDGDLVEFGKDDIHLQKVKHVFPGEPIPENW